MVAKKKKTGKVAAETVKGGRSSMPVTIRRYRISTLEPYLEEMEQQLKSGNQLNTACSNLRIREPKGGAVVELLRIVRGEKYINGLISENLSAGRRRAYRPIGKPLTLEERREDLDKLRQAVEFFAKTDPEFRTGNRFNPKDYEALRRRTEFSAHKLEKLVTDYINLFLLSQQTGRPVADLIKEWKPGFIFKV